MSPKTHSQHHQHQRGLSVVEALVALALASLTLVAVFQTQTRLRFSSDAARQRSEALRLVHHEIENLHDLSFRRNLQGSSAWADLTSTPPTEVGTPGTSFTSSFQLARQVVVSGPTDLGPIKAVRLTVSWTDRQGLAQSLSLDTLLAGQDPGDADWMSRGVAPLRPWP